MPVEKAIRWSSLLAALRRTPAALRELVSGIENRETQARPAPGSWSVCETIAHLCAVELPYRARLVRITLEDNPRVSAIGRITGDFDPQTPVSILLDTYAALRADTVRFLERLPVDARARTADHEELGSITLRSQVEALLAHDRDHLVQVAAVLGRTLPSGK